MRTTKMVTSIVAALGLVYASGCCETNQKAVVPGQPYYNCPPPVVNPGVTYQPQPIMIQPAAVQPVAVQPAPKPRKCGDGLTYRQRKLRQTRVPRRRAGCWYPNDPNFWYNGAPAYYPGTVYTTGTTGTAGLLTNSDYVPAVMTTGQPIVTTAAPVDSVPVVTSAPVLAPAPIVMQTEVAGRSTMVLQRGRKGRKVAVRHMPRAAVQPVAYAPTATMGPVYSDPVPYTAPITSEPYIISPVYNEPSVVPVSEPIFEPISEPVTMTYVAEPEPVAMTYIAEPEPIDPQPTAEPVRVLPLDSEPALAPVVYQAPAPEPVVQTFQQPIIQPVVIQPIIQPIFQPMEQQVLSSQVQAVPAPIMLPAQPAPLPLPPMSAAPAPYYPPVQAPLVMSGSGFEPGLISSAYCPPDICPVPSPVLCAPGQNLSECFTLSENQLLNGPQVMTPNAFAPLPVTGSADPFAPGSSTSFGTPAAPASALSSKYEALTPPVDVTRPTGTASRPQVNMPTPIGGENIPPVPGTGEIENALDAMLSRDAQMPNLK